MADCTCLWIVIGFDVDCWSAKLLTCCCRVSCKFWTTPGDSGAEGTGIRLLRDEAALFGRVEVFLKESSCFFTVCATSTFGFVKHAASLREISASKFSDCVSWSTSHYSCNIVFLNSLCVTHTTTGSRPECIWYSSSCLSSLTMFSFRWNNLTVPTIDGFRPPIFFIGLTIWILEEVERSNGVNIGPLEVTTSEYLTL